MLVGIPRERSAGERRVSLTPPEVARLQKKGFKFVVETGAGVASGIADDDYSDAGAELVAGDAELWARAELVAAVRGYSSDVRQDESTLEFYRQGQVLVSMMDPLGQPARVDAMARRGTSLFALELIPRITRAQSMDVLSSMATIAGYKAVLMAALELPKLFPMLMTAAGTLTPAKVFVVGVGVAGLQAIATAKRLGAVVHAYDIRPEVKEQVQSVGGKFVELDLQTDEAGDSGGYAKEQSDDFYQRQQEMMAEYVRGADVVITTAAIPGRRAPVLVKAEMMRGMRPGSIVVDLAAETGGNCELTKSGETVVHDGVKVIGPEDVPSSVAAHASQMYARNMANFLMLLRAENGAADIDSDDEIIVGTLVGKGGEITNQRVKDALERV